MDQLSASQQVLLNHAQKMHRNGRVREAVKVYQELYAEAPEHAQILFFLGTAELQLGRAPVAIPLLQEALKHAPELGGARSNLAVAMQQAGRYDEALAIIDTAIESLLSNVGHSSVASAPLYLNRGNILRHLTRNAEAMEAYSKAIELSPRYAEAYNNRGSLKREMGFSADALPDYQNALTLNPRYSEAFNNRGAALRDIGDIDGACASFRQALAINPSNAGAQWQLGTLQLLQGDFASGWKNYQARWQSPLMQGSLRDFDKPLWLGDADLRGKTILIYAEQGLGDTIQFCRYIPLLSEMGAAVVMEVPKPLVRLMRSLPGKQTVCQAGLGLPPFDYHCPMMSLPLAFGTRVDTIPAQMPYLAADPQDLTVWRKRLVGRSRPRIGVCWAGRRGAVPDRWRNIPPVYLTPLLEMSAEFHVLQKEVAQEDLAIIQDFPNVALYTDYITDFADTAALIAQMDLVISVDTAVAHVAAALAIPVWIITPQHPEWRWFLSGEKCPWYPSARLFRPAETGGNDMLGENETYGWQRIIEHICVELHASMGVFKKV